MTLSQFSSGKGPSWERPWTKMVLISTGLHLLTLALLLNVIPHGAKTRPMEPAYIVNLVSAPEGESRAKSAEVIGTVPSPPKPQFTPVPIPLPRPVFTPKPDVKKTPEIKENPSKDLEKALEKLNKKVEKEKSLEKSLGHLEKKVKEEQALEKAFDRLKDKKQSPAGVETGVGGGGTGSIASFAPGNPDGLGIQFQLYHASLRSRIKSHWVLPEGLFQKTDVSAEVVIRISRNGKIDNSRFERKSGLEAFDQEVLRTLKKSDPLPPLPEGYPKNSYEVILTFHSKELSRN